MACGVHNGSPEFCVAHRILENRRRVKAEKKAAFVGALGKAIRKAFWPTYGAASIADSANTYYQRRHHGLDAPGYLREFTSDGLARTHFSDFTDQLSTAANGALFLPGIRWYTAVPLMLAIPGIKKLGLKSQQKATERLNKSFEWLARSNPDYLEGKVFGKYG